MELDELQRIWDSQNNQPMYAINEKALYERILVKKRQGYHITNASELLTIVVNAAGGCFILAMNFSLQSNISLYAVLGHAVSAYMLCSALYVLVSRLRRIKASHRFDRSLHGDLDHAIAVAAYQVRLARVLRWNTAGLLLLVGIWVGGKSLWITAGIVICFVIAHYASRWEYRLYKTRKRELEALREKLQHERLTNDPAS